MSEEAVEVKEEVKLEGKMAEFVDWHMEGKLRCRPKG